VLKLPFVNNARLVLPEGRCEEQGIPADPTC